MHLSDEADFLGMPCRLSTVKSVESHETGKELGAIRREESGVMLSRPSESRSDVIEAGRESMTKADE
jgi:hypothetical protein